MTLENESMIENILADMGNLPGIALTIFNVYLWTYLVIEYTALG